MACSRAVAAGVVQLVVRNAQRCRQREGIRDVRNLIDGVPIGAEGYAYAAIVCTANEALVRAVAIGDLEGDACPLERPNRSFLSLLCPQLLEWVRAQ